MSSDRKAVSFEHRGVVRNGEIRIPTGFGEELKGVSGDLDFLILCREGKRGRVSSLKKSLGGEWVVRTMNGEVKKHETLREFGKFYWAHRGDWDKEGKWDQYKKFRREIMDFLSKRILQREDAAGVWRLVGDETFIEDQSILRYIWVVVPPGSKLNPEMGYHATDGNHKRTRRMVKQLIKKNVRIHVFEAPHDSNRDDYTNRILPHTIPVLMDFVRSQINEDPGSEVPLRIIAEGYSNRTAMWGETMPFHAKYNEKAVLPKKAGSGPNFLRNQPTPHRFTPKDGHPLLAYPDAVGKVMSGRPKDFFSATLEKLEPLVQRWTFQEAAILSSGMLSRTKLEKPADFYKELRSLPNSENLRIGNKSLERIVNFYSKNLVKSLRVGEFIEFEKRPGPTNYQWASERMIQDIGGIERWLEQTKDESYRERFEIYFSGIASAGRKTDGASILKYGNLAQELIEKHRSKLREERISKFQNVMEAACQRFFKFDWKEDRTIEELHKEAMANYSDKDDWNYFQIMLLREAQRDGPQVSPSILSMQRDLCELQISRNVRGTNRRPGYLLEMLIDLSRKDPDFLEQALETRNDFTHELMDEWGLAAQLKLGVMLNEDGRQVPSDFHALLKKLDVLDFEVNDSIRDNPIVRCLAWGARICDILDDGERRDRLTRLLRKRAEESIDGTREPLRDSVGVSHACHIISLEENGWGRLGQGVGLGDDYLRLVRERSYPSTKKWLEEKTLVGDPLAPLNLQHR